MAMLMFVSMDSIAKTLIRDYSVVQVVWARYFFHVAVLVIVLFPQLPTLIRTKNPALQLTRSLLLLLTTALFFYGLRFLPLATSSSIMLLSPIFVTALSWPLLKEYVGPRRWAGILIGFAGALIIIRPGTDSVESAMLFPLGAAVLYALYQISTRMLRHGDTVLTTLLYSALIGMVITSAFVPFYWVSPKPQDWGLMVGLGTIGGLGHFALINAYTSAQAVSVAPFSYSNMIWAITYGYFVFGDWPDNATLAGAAIIIVSGLYIFFREQQRKKADQLNQ